LDAARDVRGRKHDQLNHGLPEFRQSGIVKVRNNTGGDLVRFEVLAIASPIIQPFSNITQFKREVALEGVIPDVRFHRGRFVVLLEPLAADAIGRAYISGVCPVRVSVDSASHEYADITDLQTGWLTSSSTGSAHVLWKDPLSEWAVVRLSNPSSGDLLTWQACLYSDQTVDSSTEEETLRLNTVDLADSAFSVSASYELSISQTGRYLVTLHIDTEAGDTASWVSPRKANAWIERGSGSSWTKLAPSVCELHTEYITTDMGQATFLVEHANVNLKYRVRGTRFNKLPAGTDDEDCTYVGSNSGSEGCWWNWTRTGLDS
jgi:hypothetical protein